VSGSSRWADLSVVVPSWNARELLRACLGALGRALAAEPWPGGVEVIVVDDASSDGSADMVAREYPAVTLLRRATNGGYAVATNAGAARARGAHLLLLNSDAEVGAGDLSELRAALAADPGLGAVAPRLVNADGSTQRACMRFPLLRTALFFGTPLERWFPRSRELERYRARDLDPEQDAQVEQPPAACLLLRRAAWDAAGPLDESLAVFFNDVDLCRRLRSAGWRIGYRARCAVRHHGGGSTRHLADFVPRWHADRLAYYRKHHGRLGALLVKLCAAWTFADWAARNLARRLRRAPAAEPLLPMTRAFAHLLRQ